MDVLGLTNGVAAVSTGEQHTCALTTSGGVKCWGNNEFGQLGDGTNEDRTAPVDVVGLTIGVATVSTGQHHTCVLTAAGGLKCWGANGTGQLGDGTTTDRNSPVDVPGLTGGIVAVSAGSNHTCALNMVGGLKCWGWNFRGNLGDGTTTRRIVPVDVDGLTSGVAAVAPGYDHTCALTIAGGLKCWGNNTEGQLGDGTTTRSLTPVDVSGLASGIAAVSAGFKYTCARTTMGGLKCWGWNDLGQLGDGTTTRSLTPVDVSGLASGVAAAAVGIWRTCALTTTGDLKCWGGDPDSTTPVEVFGLDTGAVVVSAGVNHTCVLTTASGVRCWGFSGFRRSSSDRRSYGSDTPVDVTGMNSEVVALSAGGGRLNELGGGVTGPEFPSLAGGPSCVVTIEGGVKCWGWLGDAASESAVVVDVTGLTSGVDTVSVAGSHACVVTTAGGVKCWDWPGDGTMMPVLSTPVEVVGLTGSVAAVSVARRHTCAVTMASGVKCWGRNEFGQLGDGTTTDQTSPVEVVGLTSGVAAVSVARRHTCAVTMASGVKCWGRNEFGQLGDGTTTDQTSPVEVVGLTSGVAAVSVARRHTCAVTMAGGVKCWGSNEFGQLGDGTTTDQTSPVEVVGLTSRVAAVSTGDFHTCALTTRGGVKCWRRNELGQLGDGSTEASTTPVDVEGLSTGVADLSVGSSHVCGVTTAGGLKCWGAGGSGRLGDGTRRHSSTPIDVAGFVNWWLESGQE